jgi:hypothetical protein
MNQNGKQTKITGCTCVHEFNLTQILMTMIKINYMQWELCTS